MLPLVPAREQQHHDVRQHAGLGHGQLDEDMNLENMLPLRQAFNLDQDDAMLEDDNNQLREHFEIDVKKANDTFFGVNSSQNSDLYCQNFISCRSRRT